MKKRTAQINEDVLKKIVSESIDKVLSENAYDEINNHAQYGGSYGMPNYRQDAEKKVRQCVTKGNSVMWSDFAAALDSVAALISSQTGDVNLYYKYLHNLSMLALNKSKNESGGIRGKMGNVASMFRGNGQTPQGY